MLPSHCFTGHLIFFKTVVYFVMQTPRTFPIQEFALFLIFYICFMWDHYQPYIDHLIYLHLICLYICGYFLYSNFICFVWAYFFYLHFNNLYINLFLSFCNCTSICLWMQLVLLEICTLMFLNYGFLICFIFILPSSLFYCGKHLASILKTVVLTHMTVWQFHLVLFE